MIAQDPYFETLFALAESRLGATAPNPSVAALAIDAEGRVLSAQAHPGAGHPHAEALVLAECRERGVQDLIHTLYVTLEPCNHQGRTPPCTEAIRASGVKKVIAACSDPNPKVAGGGIAALKKHGISAEFSKNPEVKKRGENLIRAFSHWSRTGLPYVTVKRAFDERGSMIPPAGVKTFTSVESLKFAHALRKRADAILTGSGTVLADRPEFTVRHLPDHAGKLRWLVILDRSDRVTQQAQDWLDRTRSLGFRAQIAQNLPEALSFLGREGVLEVLVEAGPRLSSSVFEAGLWNESVTITKRVGEADLVEVTTKR